MRERPGRGWGWQPDKRRHPAAAARPRAPAQAAFLPRVPPSSVGMQLEHPCGSSTKIPRRWDTLCPSAPWLCCPTATVLPFVVPKAAPSVPPSPAQAQLHPLPVAARLPCLPLVHVGCTGATCRSVPSPRGVPAEPCLSQPHSPACGAGQPPAPCTDPPALHRSSSPARTPPALQGPPRPMWGPPSPGTCWHCQGWMGTGDTTAHRAGPHSPVPSRLESFGAAPRTMPGSQTQHHPDAEVPQGDSGGLCPTGPCQGSTKEPRPAPVTPWHLSLCPSDTLAAAPHHSSAHPGSVYSGCT